jgi:hypothetical protein
MEFSFIQREGFIPQSTDVFILLPLGSDIMYVFINISVVQSDSNFSIVVP